MTYQIVVPTNSEYAVGVKVAKDGQVVDGNLSVDGMSATTKIGDYSIVKLSSDGVEGMKRLDVYVSADVDTFNFSLQVQ